MSLFTRLFASFRIEGSKPSRVIYMDVPLTIRPSQIEEIATALQEGVSHDFVRVFVNKRPIDPFRQSSVTEAIHRSSIVEPVRSVSLHNGEVDVWLAWGASAQARSSDLNSLGTLWKVQRVLEGAKWPFGTFLVRYWGVFVAVLVAILVVLYTLNVSPTAQRDAIAVTASVGTALILLTTGLVAFSRRVRLDIPSPNRKSAGGLRDFLFQAFFVPGAGLMLSAVWPLAVTWWSTITGAPIPSPAP